MALDVLAYPRARLSRQGPTPTTFAPLAEGEVITPPTVSILTFRIGTATTLRSTVSSRRLFGPALLRSYSFLLGGVASGGQAIELGISATSITELDVARDGPRPWRSLTERPPANANGDLVGRLGMPESDFVAGVPARNDNANIPIVDAEFFLTVTNYSTAGTDVFAGHVIIAERVSPEVLANFL